MYLIVTEEIYFQMDIQLLKSRLDIITIAEHLGIAINKSGKSNCPFHEDGTPSLQFSKEKQICTCFSSNCGAGTMDVVALTQKKQGWNLPETLNWLQEQSGEQVLVKEEALSQSERTELLKELFEGFERSFTIKPNTVARDYVESRGLNPHRIVAGYNAGTFHHTNKENCEQYEKLGLLKKARMGYHVFGKGCIVFPLRNQAEQITGLYFRETDTNKKVQHYYLKNRQGLYPSYPKAETERLVLTESVIDAETIRQHTNYEVLACYGTEGTAEQLKAIKGLQNLKELIIFFDGDQPGREGAKKLAA
ncbi:CHC2 zinc finger domain-containing protein, partial [Chitinophagales bacterium]|nr:CHC2 zinc finger domain-containing protein [Chitinophagales bacterium]